MEIRDLLHGTILVEPDEIPILDSRYFQRLRTIKQLGFTEFSFPSATHNRYIHSLGAMHTATRAYESIFSSHGLSLKKDNPTLFLKLRTALRLATLLHDIGHGPLSHTTEFAMPPVKSLGLDFDFLNKKNRKATHEDYTLKMILNSGLTPLLKSAGKKHGFSEVQVASLVEPRIADGDDFFKGKVGGQWVDFQLLLQQLVSSELDADRMDYLRRDSLMAGVSYGNFDYDWLLQNLTTVNQKGRFFLALNHRALFSFEDFLISRFHMFLMVYFHYKSEVYDEMLAQYFAASDCDYAIPSDIEAYCDYNDAHIYNHLAQSKNPWAKRISNRQAYKLLVELHSGIPATQTAATEHERLLKKIEKNLENKGIFYLKLASTSELSKYFKKPGHTIYVHYDNHYSAPATIPLDQCTDLFERYRAKRTITRIYVSPEDLPKCKSEGRTVPLKYQETENL